VARTTRAREARARYASSTAVVVDASVASVWFANEPDPSGAIALLESELPLLAPDLMAAEVANAWWKKVRRREMHGADAEQAVTNLLALGIAWTPSPQLLPQALRLAVEIRHPVYDCLYLALATSRGVQLATGDDRLRRAAEGMGVQIWRRP
jgi:predicted nucleic acid-binding protein